MYVSSWRPITQRRIVCSILDCSRGCEVLNSCQVFVVDDSVLIRAFDGDIVESCSVVSPQSVITSSIISLKLKKNVINKT